MAHRPWLDVTVPLHSGLVHWPGDPPLHLERTRDLERGDDCTISTLTMSSHTGTHMDAPLHFVRAGKGLDEMPIETTIGPARVIAVADPESVKPAAIVNLGIRRGERILFKTRNSRRAWSSDPFNKDFVFIEPEAAQILAQRGVRLVGVDYLSVGGYQRNGEETHRILLSAGVWILEGLNLAQVVPGRYELICLPLRVAQSDGAPARAILRAAAR